MESREFERAMEFIKKLDDKALYMACVHNGADFLFLCKEERLFESNLSHGPGGTGLSQYDSNEIIESNYLDQYALAIKKLQDKLTSGAYLPTVLVDAMRIEYTEFIREKGVEFFAEFLVR